MIDKILNDKFSESIEDKLDYKGMSMEFSENLIKEIQTDGFIGNISEYIEKEDLRTYIDYKYMDKHMILYVLQGMLKNGEAKIVFTEKAKEKDINYLKKLAKCND